MNVLAFAASSHRQSINQKLVFAAADLLASSVSGVRIDRLDLNDYDLPLFSEDCEKVLGQPEQAVDFCERIAQADALLIAFAEHNGTYTAAFKNIFDWASRVKKQVFQGKPAVYFAASPGAGGAGSVLAQAVQSAPYFGAEVKTSLSIPLFHSVFDSETGKFRDEDARTRVAEAVNSLHNLHP